MAAVHLKRTKIDKELLVKLYAGNIYTCQDLLLKNKLELQKVTGRNLSAVEDSIRKASLHIVPKPLKALELWERNVEKLSFLGTSLDLLDNVLHGGLPLGTITEVAGPSGCGKTQFSIMMSVISCRSHDRGGLRGSVIYIDTESAFSAERLIEIAENRYPEEFATEDNLLDLTSRIHIYNETTCKDLQNRLDNLEEDIIEHNVKLIVLDSVASLVRKEFDSRAGGNLAERTKLLAKQAALLKYIAETFHIPVLVTNQITTRYGQQEQRDSSGQTPGERSLEGESGYVTAALGNTWSHCVNTRLIVQYLDHVRRQILVAKSPVAPFATFTYRICDSGLQLEDGGGEHYDGTDPGLQNIRVRTSLPHLAFTY